MTPTDEVTEYNLTVDDVAEMFGVDPRTVRRWINTGKLPAQRLPGARQFKLRRSDIDEALGDISTTASSSADSGRGGMHGLNIADALLAAEEDQVSER